MCIGDKCDDEIVKNGGIERRSFLTGVATAVVGTALGSEALGQHPSKALDDPDIIHGKVTFKSGGSEIIGGYLARPKKKGDFPAVIIVPGNRIEEMRVTAFMQRAFVPRLAANNSLNPTPR